MEQLLDSVPGGWLGMVLVLVLVGPPTLLSRFATRLPGFLGAGARHWQDRQLHAVDREMTFEKKIEEAVERRVKVRLNELDQFKADVENMREEMEEIRADRDLAYDYIAHEAGWYRAINILAKQENWNLSPPERMSFQQFKASRLL